MLFDATASTSFFVQMIARLCPDINPADYTWMCSIDVMFVRFGLDVCDPHAFVEDSGSTGTSSRASGDEDEREDERQRRDDNKSFAIVGFVSGAATLSATVEPAVEPSVEPAMVAGLPGSQEAPPETPEQHRSSRQAMVMRSDDDIRRAFGAILHDDSYVADRTTVVMMFPASSSELNIPPPPPPPIPVGLLLTHGADRWGVDTSAWVTSVRKQWPTSTSGCLGWQRTTPPALNSCTAMSPTPH